MLNHPDLSNICIYIADGALTSANLLAHLKSFASEYHLQVFSGPSVRKTKDFPRDVCAYPYVIYLAESSICIWQTAKGAPGPVSASFASGKSLHRLKFGGGKGQLIAKAVGLDKGIYPSVLDATAGLGRDSFVLASLGCHVQMIERSPVIALLLQSALEEVLMSQSDESLILQEICSRMSLRVSNATDWLRNQTETVADVIYVDPMYPEREKSSLVKKEMRLFHDLVGADADDSELLSVALQRARYRVVVKRPRKGEVIAGVNPTFQILGKSSRYDIYVIKSLDYLAK